MHAFFYGTDDAADEKSNPSYSGQSQQQQQSVFGSNNNRPVTFGGN